jgi:pimeloyl-ACP methyl ester carboxylesterase
MRAALSAPAPPSPREERVIASLLERAYLRELRHGAQDPPPAEWGAEPFGIVRAKGGILAALHFPAPRARGVVVFGHPGIPAAKGYFHRSDRIPFVRALGFAAMTFDHGGFGESDDPTQRYDEEWAEALAWARRRHPDVPIHLWGVSMGGYFAHHALAADEQGVTSAIFEQVTPNLLHYGGSPALKAAGAMASLAAPAVRRWLPAEAHAPRMAAEHVLYVSGDADHGITRAEATRLAEAAGPFARHHVVEGAGHLDAWKLGGDALRKAIEGVLSAT